MANVATWPKLQMFWSSHNKNKKSLRKFMQYYDASHKLLPVKLRAPDD